MKKYFLLSCLALSSLSFADEIAEDNSLAKQIVSQVNDLKKRINQIEQKVEKSSASTLTSCKTVEKQQKTLEEQFYQINDKMQKRDEILTLELGQIKQELSNVGHNALALQNQMGDQDALLSSNEKLQKHLNDFIQKSNQILSGIQHSETDLAVQINQLKQDIASQKQLNVSLQNQLQAQMQLVKEHTALHEIAHNEIAAIKGLNSFIQNSLQAEEARRAELTAAFDKMQVTFVETEKRIDKKDLQEKSKYQAMTARMENLLQQIEDLQRKSVKR